MGAFRTDITISTSDEVFTVNYFRVKTSRLMNGTGKVTTTTRGNDFEFRTPSSESTALAEAMMTCGHTHFDVKVEIFASDHTGVQKTIELKNCIMVEFSESFNSDTNAEASTYCRVTANTMIIGGTAELASNWVNT